MPDRNRAEVSVGIAIVVYAQLDEEVRDLFRQLDSLTTATAKRYVVCNMPGRDPSAVIGDAELISPGQNVGFCAGMNLAAGAAREDGCSHLLLLNTDIQILAPDLIDRLLDPFDALPDCAFVSPGIVSDENRVVVYRGGELLRPWWVTRHPGLGKRWSSPSRGTVPTDYFTGCCALADLAAFWSVGGFDEELFMYYDEADLASRAASRSLRSYLVDEPLIAHAKVGKRLGEIEAFFFARNAALLLARNEVGWRRLAGRVGQLVLAPRFLARCDSARSRRSFVAGSVPHPKLPFDLPSVATRRAGRIRSGCSHST